MVAWRPSIRNRRVSLRVGVSISAPGGDQCVHHVAAHLFAMTPGCTTQPRSLPRRTAHATSPASETRPTPPIAIAIAIACASKFAASPNISGAPFPCPTIALLQCIATRRQLPCAKNIPDGHGESCDQRKTQADIPSLSRKSSQESPCSMARVDSTPASIQLGAATVTARGAPTIDMPVRGSRMCE